MELSVHNLSYFQLRGTDNILADAVSHLKMLQIYTEPLENPKTVALSNTEECIAEVVANKIKTLSTDRLHAKQRKDTNCRNLATQLCHKNRNSFNLVMISADGLLHKQ